MIHEGRPWGPGGHLSGPGGSSEWSWWVILVVHEGRPWGPGGDLSGPGGSSWWSMRVIRGVQVVI